MKKLPVLVFGLAVTASSCVAAGAPNRLAETTTPTASPSIPAEATEPAATATRPTLSEEDIIAPTPSGKSFQPQLRQVSINPNEIVTLLPPDAIPAILPDRVPQIMVPAPEADAGGIDDSVQVIGVNINGESRAYPIPFLSRHEIVNDEIGGERLAITW